MTVLSAMRAKGGAATARPDDGARSALSSVAIAAVALTLAGMLWVALGTAIAGRGLRINQIVTERQSLLTRRASARLHLAQLTHPDSLDVRARAMGFGPRPDTQGVAIIGQPGTRPVAESPAAERPLAFRMSARQELVPEAGMDVLLGIFRSEEVGP